jgi:hypothetical protein
MRESGVGSRESEAKRPPVHPLSEATPTEPKAAPPQRSGTPCCALFITFVLVAGAGQKDVFQ